MRLRKMTREDWPWIQDWFRDDQLNRELGPIDEEWLDYVLRDHGGVELVAIDEDEPVALIGCVWAQDAVGFHTITDLAVSPRRRQTGFGRRALHHALRWSGHPPAGGWAAYVDPANTAALAFLTALGWDCCGMDDVMYRFELKPTTGYVAHVRPRRHCCDGDI